MDLQLIRICISVESELPTLSGTQGEATMFVSYRVALGASVALGLVSGAAIATGALSRQIPIEVTVVLGSPRCRRIHAEATAVRDPAQRQQRSALLHLKRLFADG